MTNTDATGFVVDCVFFFGFLNFFLLSFVFIMQQPSCYISNKVSKGNKCSETHYDSIDNYDFIDNLYV